MSLVGKITADGPQQYYSAPQSSRFLRCRVIGPLLKRHVAAVRRSALPSLPVLACSGPGRSELDGCKPMALIQETPDTLFYWI
jgi:hypothetical protein